MEKLVAIEGVELYEIPRNEWQDDSDLWSSITCIQFMNYKSLDCYKIFVSGKVREVLVKEFSGVRAVIGKVTLIVLS